MRQAKGRGATGDAALRRFVLLVCLLGVMAAAATVTLAARGWLVVPENLTGQSWLPTALIVTGMAVLSQLAFVRVPHGDVYEDLAFFEVVAAAGLLMLAPVPLLAALLLGLLVAEVSLRRPPMKLAYNLGSFAVSTSIMICSYRLLDAGSHPLGVRSVVAMLLAVLLFTLANLALLAELLHLSTDQPRSSVWRQEWRLSVFMAVGGVGVGMTAVALAWEAPALVPFSALPALALWYAYRAAADHAIERERNRWLIELGGILAGQVTGRSSSDEALLAVQRIVRAPSMTLLPAGTATQGRRSISEHPADSPMSGDPSPRRVPPAELPEGWRSALATPVDVGEDRQGVLLLGSRDGDGPTGGFRNRAWELTPADAPVLSALVAATGTATRAAVSYLALAEESAKLSAVVDHASDGIAMLDELDRVLVWSRTMAQITGVPAEEVLGREGILPDVAAQLVAAAQIAPGGPDLIHSHEHLVLPEGIELDVKITAVVASPVSGTTDPRSRVRVVTVHDETREKRLGRLKSDFIATVSHELRTPLTPIKGYAQLLATRGDRLSPERRQQALTLIADRSDHLARLVDDLLLASEVSDAAGLPIELEDVAVAEIVRQVVDGFPGLADRLTVELPAAGLNVHADRLRAVQCLSNLLSNASKYTPEDAAIEIQIEAGLQFVAVHVRDHGPGIRLQDRERIFERFYRGDDPLTSATGGTGLGLHISRELAAAMGGSLTLVNPPEGGADFVLRLPVVLAHHRVTQFSASMGSTRPGSDAR